MKFLTTVSSVVVVVMDTGIPIAAGIHGGGELEDPSGHGPQFSVAGSQGGGGGGGPSGVSGGPSF
jgi:hypothetical protein